MLQGVTAGSDAMEPGSEQPSVKLQHDGTRAAFMCGSTCLEVSDRHTSCSRLLEDVCESSDGNFELEVPLSLAEAQAWLEYVDHSQGPVERARPSDIELLRALRVRFVFYSINLRLPGRVWRSFANSRAIARGPSQCVQIGDA